MFNVCTSTALTAQAADLYYPSRHADREAEPMDYDISKDHADRNLLRATYNRIGAGTDGVRGFTFIMNPSMLTVVCVSCPHKHWY